MMPDPADYKAFLALFDHIETGKTELRNPFHGKQLACISRLVFYCGVQRKEIPELLVRDMIGQDGRLLIRITRFEQPIVLNRPAYNALERYLAELKKKPPKFLNRKSYFFPNFQNVEKLQEDWSRFGTNYREIRKAAFHHYVAEYASNLSSIHDCAEQLRVAPRYFQTVYFRYRVSTRPPL